MIGPEMFKQFALGELIDTCNFLDRSCYHLDGVKQIKHLEQLIKIERLNLIQWVPGTGTYDSHNWIEVYKKILNGGKHLQLTYDTDYKSLNELINFFGTGANICSIHAHYSVEQRNYAKKILSSYNIE
jgi:hypothetical protein